MAAGALVAVVTLGGCLSTLSDPLSEETGSIIGFDAASLRNLTRISDDGIDKAWLTVSGDGQKLLYCEQSAEFNLFANSKRESSRIMYLRDVSVFAKTPLAESYTYSPAFYENGTSFVYVLLNQGYTQLVKDSVPGGGRTVITSIGQWDNHPSIRESMIACDTYINNQRQIVTLRDNGTGLTIRGPGSQPSWHPTENKLLFVRDESIWEMDTETTRQTRLHAVSDNERTEGMWAGSPSYTGDGNYIVFVKRVKAGFGLRLHLFVMDCEGNNLVELTTGNIDTWMPTVGAGNRIFFLSNAGGKIEIWSAFVTLD